MKASRNVSYLYSHYRFVNKKCLYTKKNDHWFMQKIFKQYKSLVQSCLKTKLRLSTFTCSRSIVRLMAVSVNLQVFVHVIVGIEWFTGNTLEASSDRVRSASGLSDEASSVFPVNHENAII